ncbi:MAG TPA: homoserine O-succinyltransferase [Roseiarcus sp.]|nr:homoserine O-succinyltransferase [Roseiarcus sp.]
MPIKIPDKLPAYEALMAEGVRVMTDSAAIRQDIRPMQIGLLNLMPNKIMTELQLARLLAATPLQVELSLVRLGTHRAKHTPEDHMMAFYSTWEEVRLRKFDGFIVTGTPLETIPYEEVRSWPEVQQIFEWTRSNVHSSMFVCWGAMAALHHFHGAPKRLLEEKAFGVYPQKILAPTSPYLAGFADDFATPISRWAQIEPADLHGRKGLEVLAQNDERGVSIAAAARARRLYVLDHLEYDATSLADEYFRDVKAGVPINPPKHYFPDENPANAPPNTWRAHGHLLLSNWINAMYQTTPFEPQRIGG